MCPSYEEEVPVSMCGSIMFIRMYCVCLCLCLCLCLCVCVCVCVCVCLHLCLYVYMCGMNDCNLTSSLQILLCYMT